MSSQNPRYQITVYSEKSLEGDHQRTTPEVVLTQTFEKFGAMLLWCQGWFKTTGANRRRQYDKYSGRTYHPKTYAIAKGGHNFNLYRTEDFSLFTEEKFLEGYNTWWRDSDKGTHIVEVYQNAGRKGEIVVLTLYCKPLFKSDSEIA